ncbi:hypothetical protein ACCS69_33880 [Rhizobium johnstonii]|uniref:hypothetical protein n=1 Tax=Rhizobium johnstonii TaxID=3019933 RepID=UPI003F9E75CE
MKIAENGFRVAFVTELFKLIRSVQHTALIIHWALGACSDDCRRCGFFSGHGKMFDVDAGRPR